MQKNFYSIIKLLLDVVIEKNLSPIYTARTLFILPSTVTVGLGTIDKSIKLLEEYNYKYEHPNNINLSCNEKNIFIMFLTNHALELLNRDLQSKLINVYLINNKIQIDFINNKIIQNIVYEMTYYYNYRNKDGWQEANKQIILPNSNYINVNEPLNINNFNDQQSWCPLQGQKMLGARWGKVKNILKKKDINNINKFIDSHYNVDIKSQCKEVLSKSLSLTDKEKMISEFWSGISKSVTPPGFFNMFLFGYFRSNSNSNKVELEYFYKLNTGLFQASITVWDAKYRFIQCRPIQSIRLNYPDIPIDYYFGKSNTSVWKPYQQSRSWTPPFPDYISGHSAFSSVASCILTKLLGSNVSKLNIKLTKDEFIMLSPIFLTSNFDFMDISNIVIAPDSSKIQKNVPHKEILLNFNTWEEMAESAGISRIYGGIHYPTSNIVSLEVGKMICNKLLH